MSYTSWDCETTIQSKFKRKASPFHIGNWVVTHAFKHKGGAIEEHRFGRHRPPAGWLRPVLDGTRILFGFNIKFDILHAVQDSHNLSAWMDYVASGGTVWDCQLAEYLLCGMAQKDQMLSLNEVAVRYGGEVKIDEVAALWNAGVSTEDIDPDLLSRYLCGGKDETGCERVGDIGNTELIALKQIERARACGQLNSIMLNMGSLLCSIEMERNGLYVDKELGLKLAAELKIALDALKIELDKHLPSDLPFAFNWGSPKQKSALIFGGTVCWDGHEYDLDCVDLDEPDKARGAYPRQILKHEYEALPVDKRPQLLYAQKDVECCTVAVEHLLYAKGTHIPMAVAQREGIAVERFSSGKKEGEAKVKKVKRDNLDKPKGRSVRVPYTFPRKTEPKREWLGADPGVWSTSSEVIAELGNRDIPFLKVLAELSAVTKDLGTYFIVTDEETGESKGMLSLVDDHGIIHHSINHSSTVTGRFSSSNPNLQNIPKGNKSKVKTVFKSRFGEDGKLVQSDFSALEIYIQAILTKCTQLIEDLKQGLDMHVLRLSNSPAGEGKSYADLLVLCKGDKKTNTPAVDAWGYKRTDSKVYSFQAAYGAGDKKIAETTGMAEETVAALRAADDKRYPEITKYFDKRADEIKLNRKGQGVIAVPHPDIPGAFCHLGTSKVRTPDGKLYSYQEHPAPTWLVKRGTYASFSPTEIKNYEVQGEGAEWAKAAMWLAVRAFYKNKNFGGQALLVNQVHDAMYVDAHLHVAIAAAALLHACMEGANDLMEFMFHWPIPVAVPSETSMGASMMDDESIPGLQQLADIERKQLRVDYLGNYLPSFIKD